MIDSPARRVLTLARHEYRAAVRSRVILGLFAVLAVATMASVYVGAVDYRGQLADYEAYRAAAQAGGVTQIAPSPLALLSLLRGAMEYLEIIGAVIAITLGYLSVSRERTGRTLPLLRSRPVSAGEQSVGTVLGAVALFTTIVAATALVAVMALGLIGKDWANGAQLIKLVLAYGAAIVYLTVFYCLGAAATAQARHPATGLIVALAVWLVVVLILPQIGDTLDADNQVPGGLFASLGLGHDGEVSILAHFGTYEKVRTAIEATSFSKHFERFAFAMIDTKPRYRDLSLAQLLDIKTIEVIWMGVYTLGLGALVRRAFNRQPAIPQGA
ncbi:MAG: ABC transporter permease subunit [Acidimicrobiales bacterium]